MERLSDIGTAADVYIEDGVVFKTPDRGQTGRLDRALRHKIVGHMGTEIDALDVHYLRASVALNEALSSQPPYKEKGVTFRLAAPKMYGLFVPSEPSLGPVSAMALAPGHVANDPRVANVPRPSRSALRRLHKQAAEAAGLDWNQISIDRNPKNVLLDLGEDGVITVTQLDVGGFEKISHDKLRASWAGTKADLKPKAILQSIKNKLLKDFLH